jgi:hypothetical protein
MLEHVPPAPFLAIVVVVVVVAIAIWIDLHNFFLPTAVHLNEPADVFRIRPSFLHLFPSIEAACATPDDATAGIGCKASGSGTATGSIPVNAAAPTEIV